MMTPRLQKFALTVHVTSSVGWLGGVVCFLALVVAALTNRDPENARAAWVAMDIIGWLAIVPLSFASLLSGFVMSLGTKWGLFRHYWVVFKLILTFLATLVLVQNMNAVSFLANQAAEARSDAFIGLKGELLHAGGGLLVLLIITTLSVYKPRGLTRYGQRKQYEKRKVS